MKEIIKRGANINKEGFYGWTALSYAVSEWHKSIEGLLRNAGAEENKDDIARSDSQEYDLKKNGWGQWTPM